MKPTFFAAVATTVSATALAATLALYAVYYRLTDVRRMMGA